MFFIIFSDLAHLGPLFSNCAFAGFAGALYLFGDGTPFDYLGSGSSSVSYTHHPAPPNRAEAWLCVLFGCPSDPQ